MKHTPGPWHLIDGDEWTSEIATNTPDQGLWTVANANERRAEFKANRHLIAAAPELLEALELAMLIKDLWAPPVGLTVEPCHEGEMQALSSMLTKITKAIAKAKGE